MTRFLLVWIAVQFPIGLLLGKAISWGQRPHPPRRAPKPPADDLQAIVRAVE